MNEVLATIKNRRSVVRFESTSIDDDKVEAILEAGRWAPSWINKQPWNFTVIKDQKTKEQLSDAVPTAFVQGLKESPLCIAVTVDATEDPYPFCGRRSSSCTEHGSGSSQPRTELLMDRSL